MGGQALFPPVYLKKSHESFTVPLPSFIFTSPSHTHKTFRRQYYQ